MSKHMYFSLDSDALSNIAELAEYLESNPGATDDEVAKFFCSVKQSCVIKNLEDYRKLVEIAKDKTSPMRFLITQTPWEESLNISVVRKFVQKYCYVPKVSYLLSRKYQLKIEKLARMYCKKYTNKKGEEKDAPMSIRYNAANRDISPTNDAYAMAEATVFGACLLTENAKDFVHMEMHEKVSNGKNIIHGDNKRALGIIELNGVMGYDIVYSDHFKLTPKPWLVHGLGRFLDNLDDFRSYISDDSNYEESQIEM